MLNEQPFYGTKLCPHGSLYRGRSDCFAWNRNCDALITKFGTSAADNIFLEVAVPTLVACNVPQRNIHVISLIEGNGPSPLSKYDLETMQTIPSSNFHPVKQLLLKKGFRDAMKVRDASRVATVNESLKTVARADTLITRDFN